MSESYSISRRSVWRDPWFSELPYRAKYLFLYLYQNEQQTACGAFECTIRQMVFDTSMSADEIKTAMGQLTQPATGDDGTEYPRVWWWPDRNLVFTTNFYKHQRALSSPKFAVSAVRAAAKFPPNVYQIILDTYPELAALAANGAAGPPAPKPRRGTQPEPTAYPNPDVDKPEIPHTYPTNTLPNDPEMAENDRVPIGYHPIQYNSKNNSKNNTTTPPGKIDGGGGDVDQPVGETADGVPVTIENGRVRFTGPPPGQSNLPPATQRRVNAAAMVEHEAATLLDRPLTRTHRDVVNQWLGEHPAAVDVLDRAMLEYARLQTGTNTRDNPLSYFLKTLTRCVADPDNYRTNRAVPKVEPAGGRTSGNRGPDYPKRATDVRTVVVDPEA